MFFKLFLASGPQFFHVLIINNKSLLSKSGDVSNTPLVIANATMYDAFLEEVCVKFGVPIVSQTDRQTVF